MALIAISETATILRLPRMLDYMLLKGNLY
jgi:hypothetical protein